MRSAKLAQLFMTLGGWYRFLTTLQGRKVDTIFLTALRTGKVGTTLFKTLKNRPCFLSTLQGHKVGSIFFTTLRGRDTRLKPQS